MSTLFQQKILIIDDEPDMGWLFQETLGSKYYISTAQTWQDGLMVLKEVKPHVILLDLRLPDIDGLKALKEIKKLNPEIQIIIITAYATISNAVEAMKAGAFDYQTKPFSIDQIEKKIIAALRTYKNHQLSEELMKTTTILGKDKSTLQILQMLPGVSVTKANVMLLGESGTGKEVFAREIHRLGNLKNKPFVAINCAAVPENLMESEIFGYERGAFTGAHNKKIGKFEQAQDGTLMLDEIGDLPLLLQGKLLRVLEQREFERLGGAKMIEVNARIISATNRDLEKMISIGDFRSDLYYRLSVVPIRIPALRERPDDIIFLANHFLIDFSRKYNKNFNKLSDEVQEIFLQYYWPGNVRELKNVIEQIVVLYNDTKVKSTHVPNKLKAEKKYKTFTSLKDKKSHIMCELERKEICTALKLFNGNRTKAAKYLKISVRNLQMKVKDLSITDNDWNSKFEMY